jgi:hypothetical protein
MRARVKSANTSSGPGVADERNHICLADGRGAGHGAPVEKTQTDPGIHGPALPRADVGILKIGDIDDPIPTLIQRMIESETDCLGCSMHPCQ